MTSPTLPADTSDEAKNALANLQASIVKVKDNRLKAIIAADHRIAKNKIAIFVIKSFCIIIVSSIVYIMYGALFSQTSGWKDGIQPLMDILQKVFLPVVTLAFGFYNSNTGDK